MSLLICAAASDAATIARVGRHGDVVVLRLGLEVGHQGAVTRDIECIAGIGRDLGTVLCPVGEGVSRCCSGANSAGLTLLVGAATCDSAAFFWVGRNTDGVFRDTAADDVDGGDVSDLIVAEHGQSGSASGAGSGKGDVSGAVLDGG